MIIYLSGVIAAIAVMFVLFYVLEEDIDVSNLIICIFFGLFSWLSVTAESIVLIIYMVFKYPNLLKNKPIIKWKSQKKNT